MAGSKKSNMDDSEESDLLLAPATKAKRAINKINAAGISIVWNRIFMVIMLIALMTFGLFSESQIMELQTKLEDTEQQVHDLQLVTERQEKVMERFNQSITNEDVLKRLGVLEHNMTDTVAFLHVALKENEDLIQTRLDEESKELQNQVNAAETEIHNKVSQVEDDIRTYYIETKAQFSMENSFMVYQLAGTFTLLSCLISMWHMTAHLRKLNQPMVQRKILAILWMSPVYAITSWFSLVFPKAEGYLAIIKDGYEAYIIYQFLSFCIAVIGKGDRSKVVDILATHADHLTPPFRLTAICEICGCCKPPPYEDKRHLADEILLQCQFFALQFVFFRPLTTTAMVFLNQFHYYGGGEGPMDYRAPQLYLTVIQNISIFVAFTGLLKFYHAVDNELAWCRPLPKFLCIKGVVFMTFWQGLVIAVLAEETTHDDSNAEGWADSAQNFLICLEMLLFSIAHFYCFPTEEWQDGYRVQVSKGKFGDSIALGDFFSDIKLILRNSKQKAPKKRSKSMRKIESDPIPEEPQDLISEHTETSEEENLLRALKSSLGEDADDPEIAKATRRLLQSNVLSPAFFDASGKMQASPTNTDIEAARQQLYGSQDEDDLDIDDSDDEDLGSEGDEDDHDHDVHNDQNEVDEEVGDRLRPVGKHREIDDSVPMYSHRNYDDEPGSPFMEALRPSIFTTVASLAEMDRLAAAQRAASQMDRSNVDLIINSFVENTNFVPYSHQNSDDAQGSSQAPRPSIFSTVASTGVVEHEATVTHMDKSNQAADEMDHNVVDTLNHGIFHLPALESLGVDGSNTPTVQPARDVLETTDDSNLAASGTESDVVNDRNQTIAPTTAESNQNVADRSNHAIFHRPGLEGHGVESNTASDQLESGVLDGTDCSNLAAVWTDSDAVNDKDQGRGDANQNDRGMDELNQTTVPPDKDETQL